MVAVLEVGQRKRKLVRIILLATLWEKSSLGVPTARLIREYKLDISIPHLSKLIGIYDLGREHKDENAYKSINPKWLILYEGDIIEAPDNYKYKGMFPTGEWVQV